MGTHWLGVLIYNLISLEIGSYLNFLEPKIQLFFISNYFSRIQVLVRVCFELLLVSIHLIGM